MKRKRAGAGWRSSSNQLLSAKRTENDGFFSDSAEESDVKGVGERIKEAKTETMQSISSIRARGSAVGASLNSPIKAGRTMGKKQQKMAEAAKTSRNISQYFTNKQTLKQSCQEEEQEAVSLSAGTVDASQEEGVNEEQPERSPVRSDTPDLILVEPETEVIVVSDDEEDKEPSVDSFKPLQDESQQETSSVTE